MARDECMVAYLSKVQQVIAHFSTIKVEQIGRNLNSHADTLATLASNTSNKSFDKEFKIVFKHKVLAISQFFNFLDFSLDSTLGLGS